MNRKPPEDSWNLAERAMLDAERIMLCVGAVDAYPVRVNGITPLALRTTLVVKV